MKKVLIFLVLIMITCGCVRENEINVKEDDFVDNIKITIGDKTYSAVLENNLTAKTFVNLLPSEFVMTELNNNEKYVYLDTALPSNATNIGYINAGDIMLYGDNCLVIFYQSFNTNYSYTKIGHITNIDNLGQENIVVKFE